MSVAVVIGPPVNCSGAAYSGVSARPALASERRGLARVRLSLEQLCDAEVEQLDFAVVADEHVRRLDVPVHDQVGVGVGDGREYVEEQADPGLEAEAPFVAVPIDRRTVDVLQHEIGLAERATRRRRRDARCGGG